MSKIWLCADGSQAESRVVAWAGPIPKLKTWFRAGEDIHTNVARLMACVIQEERIKMPSNLFHTKHWREYVKGDPERQIAKQCVHANNYGLGKKKFSLIVGLPEEYAGRVQGIYFELFPDVKTGYQAWIEEQIRRTRTLVNPFGFRRVFYGRLDEELLRAAYACYASTTVGDWMGITFQRVSEHFSKVDDLELLTPDAIRGCGYDIRLQGHDSINISLDDDPDLVREVAQTVKRYGEFEFEVRGESMIIPIDFKKGPSWGETVDYKPV